MIDWWGYYALWPFFLSYVVVPTGFAVFAAIKQRPRTGLLAGLTLIVVATIHGLIEGVFVHPRPTRNLLGSVLGMLVGTLPFLALSLAAPSIATARRTHSVIVGAVTFLSGWLLVPLSGLLFLLACGFTRDCP